jgi:hypothetical protein
VTLKAPEYSKHEKKTGVALWNPEPFNVK